MAKMKSIRSQFRKKRVKAKKAQKTFVKIVKRKLSKGELDVGRK